MRFLLILLHLAVAFALAIVEQTTITNEASRIVLVELTEESHQVFHTICNARSSLYHKADLPF